MQRAGLADIWSGTEGGADSVLMKQVNPQVSRGPAADCRGRTKWQVGRRPDICHESALPN